MPTGEVSLYDAQIAFRDCLNSEIEFEVDRGPEAQEQLRNGSRKLHSAYSFRIAMEQEKAAVDYNNAVRKIQEMVDNDPQGKGMNRVNSQKLSDHFELNESLQKIVSITKSMESCEGDPENGCRLSRDLRYELTCLFIVGHLPHHIDTFIDALRVLNRLLLRYKTMSDCNLVYVRNIELRLQDLEARYEKVMGCSPSAKIVDSSEETTALLINSISQSMESLKFLADAANISKDLEQGVKELRQSLETINVSTEKLIW